jgi:hypothetical protein
MSFYKSLQDEDKNFKLKRLTGRAYGVSNGSTATFGGSRRTGSFRLWTSFTCNVNSNTLVNIGNGQQVRSKLLYNSLNQLVKKYTGSLRTSVS